MREQRRSTPVQVDALGPEQTAGLEAFLLLLGNLDVGRGEQADLVGHPRHRPAQGIGETAGEVDQPALQITVEALQVEDHRLVGLQPVADLLGVVETPWLDHVDPGGGGGGGHRPHDTGAGRGWAVVAAQRPHVGAGVGGAGGHADSVVIFRLVDEAQVHHCPSPHRSHRTALLLRQSLSLQTRRLPSGTLQWGPKIARPMRTIVAPSFTATSKSSLMPIDTSARPRRWASSASAANAGRGSRPAAGTVISPSTASPADRSPSTRAGASSGATPALAGSSA